MSNPFLNLLDLAAQRQFKIIAKREGVSEEDLAKRWMQEKLSDDLRRRLLKAAEDDTPDPQLLHEETCAVTMYDLKIRLMSDGRERGLWIFLTDESPDRERGVGKLNEGGLLEWPEAEKLHMAMGKALRLAPDPKVP